jgi:predicted nucleic acid-binding protein
MTQAVALILLDTNIFIYAHGRPHLYKEPCRLLLARVAETTPKYNIDVELLQEILHVYNGRGARGFGLAIFDILLDLFADPFPVRRSEMVAAREVLERYPVLSPRDAIHVAVVSTQRLEGIVTTDAAFGQVHGLSVFDPIALASESS